MPPVLAAIAVTAASVGSGLAAAGTALGVTAGALAAGNFALAGTALMAVGDASLIGSFTVGSVLELGALAGISALLAPQPKVNTAGSPQQFKPDTNAPIPVVMGRYGVGGNLVYETTSGGGNKAESGAKGNEYLTQFVILGGLGPYQEFETLRFNDTILTFDPNGQACNGGYIPEDELPYWNPGYRYQNPDGSYINNNYQDHAWQNIQLGALDAGYFAPPDKLAADNAALPEWTQAHGLSSFCASALTLVYDQRYYSGGVPQYQWTVQGQKIYDPRQDSTYPGGAGPQRWAGAGTASADLVDAYNTRVYNTNPAIHALNFALGHFLSDPATGYARLYAGIGAGVAGVDVPAFIRAANVADANGWIICGQWTTGDGKWDVLNEMLKACSASAVIKNGIISCIVDTPLTVLNPNAPITAADLAGPVQLPTGSSLSARINTIFPRFSSEPHRWQMVPAAAPVKAATYVTEDGGVRSKTLDWQYVPAVNQACQLAAYTITNGRELAGIQLPGKPKFRNYTVGDCLLVDIPEAGLATTKIMVTKRVTDKMTGGVTLTVRTETDAKHPYSLGVSGVAPATPGISGYDPTIPEVPLSTSWASGQIVYTDASTGESRSIIQVTGAVDTPYARDLVVRYRLVAEVNGTWTPLGSGAWSFQSFPATQTQFELDLNPGAYDVQIAYVAVGGTYPVADEDWLDLGVEIVSGSVAAAAASLGGRSASQILSDADAAAAKLEEQADAAISAALQQAAQLMALHASKYDPDGLPLGPTLKQTNVVLANQVSIMNLLAIRNPNGVGLILNTEGVYVDADGTTIAQAFNELNSAVSDVNATLLTDYMTAADTTQAIAAAETSLESAIDAVSASLTEDYYTSAQVDQAISVAQLALQDSIDGVSADLTDSYYTSAQVDQAISVAQLALQDSIDGVSADVSIQGVAIANLQGLSGGSLRLGVSAGSQAVSIDEIASDGTAAPLSLLVFNAAEVNFLAPNGQMLLDVTEDAVTLQNLVIDGGLVLDGTLAGSAIQAFGVTQTYAWLDSTTQSLGSRGSGWITMLTSPSWSLDGHPVLIDGAVGTANTSSNHDQDIEYRVLCDGTELWNWRDRVSQNSAGSALPGGSQKETPSWIKWPRPGMSDAALAAGSHVFEVQAQLLAGSDDESSKYIAKIRVQELKTETA